MIILGYKKKFHSKIIRTCVDALKSGKAVVYPTDTSYGLAVDATNTKAIKKLYKIKGRNFNKPIHVVVPSLAYAKKIVEWGSMASKLTKKFFPGTLTLVLSIKNTVLSIEAIKKLTANTGFLGIRMPKNSIALDLSKALKKPITATSANRSGQRDCYSAGDVVRQFSDRGGSPAIGGHSASGGKPDIIIDAGKLAWRKPSTVVKITPPNPLFRKEGEKGGVEVLRKGSIGLKQITDSLLNTKNTKLLNLSNKTFRIS